MDELKSGKKPGLQDKQEPILRPWKVYYFVGILD